MANADPKVGVLLCDEVCVVTNSMKSERALLPDHWAFVEFPRSPLARHRKVPVQVLRYVRPDALVAG
jgi:hypothetical protein